MKYFYLLFIGLFLIGFNSFGQSKSSKYINLGTIESPIKTYENDIEKLKKDNPNAIFNNKMLNILFAEKVGTNFGNTSDLSLETFYATYESDKNSISLGANIDLRGGSITNKLSNIISLGFEMKAENGFATLSNSDDFQEDNVALNLKFTHIFKGVINFDNIEEKSKDKTIKVLLDRKKAVENHRKDLFKKYNSKVIAYNKDSIPLKKQLLNEISQFSTIYDENLTDILKEKSNDVYEKIAREEIKYIEEYKLYRFVSDKWFTLNVNFPLGDKIYKIANQAVEPFNEEKFKGYNVDLGFSYFREYSSGFSYFILPRLIFSNNNTIIASDLKSKAFQEFEVGANNAQILNKSTDVHILENYNEFLTSTAKAEIAVFHKINGFGHIGFSPSIEKSFGTYDEVNWKLGIPFSIQDKDKKPKLNFELQWKEQNSLTTTNHYIGITTGFVFGKLID